MNTCIFHSVNSGLYFWDGLAGLLVDGIHAGGEQGFSPMPAFLAAFSRDRKLTRQEVSQLKELIDRYEED